MKPAFVTLACATAATTVVSNWFVLDRYPEDQSITVYADVSGSCQYFIERTPQDVGLDASGASVFVVASAKTTGEATEITSPAGGIRFKVVSATANEGSVRFGLVQSGS